MWKIFACMLLVLSLSGGEKTVFSADEKKPESHPGNYKDKPSVMKKIPGGSKRGFQVPRVYQDQIPWLNREELEKKMLERKQQQGENLAVLQSELEKRFPIKRFEADTSKHYTLNLIPVSPDFRISREDNRDYNRPHQPEKEDLPLAIDPELVEKYPEYFQMLPKGQPGEKIPQELPDLPAPKRRDEGKK